MKHYDGDLKKFIKNVVSLVVSAVLLVAATIAWFAQSDSASMARITASVKSQVTFSYSRLGVADTSSNFLDLNSTTNVLYLRNRSGQTETTSSVGDFVAGSGLTWLDSESAGGSNWNLSSLYPGEYGVFRIDYVADTSSRTLQVSFSDVPSDTNALDALSVYAVAQGVTTTGGGPSVTEVRTTIAETDEALTLSDLLAQESTTVEDGVTTVTVLSDITSSVSGAHVYVYYVIGMPATGSDTQHNALRLSGASISIDEVNVVATAPSS